MAEYEAVIPAAERGGVDEVLDLGFGKCELQVQVPEKGNITQAKELVGRNVVTSFVGLTERYFNMLEERDRNSEIYRKMLEGKPPSVGGVDPLQNKLRTKVKFVGGSVEAACALGVADGIVDLVGQNAQTPIPKSKLIVLRIG